MRVTGDHFEEGEEVQITINLAQGKGGNSVFVQVFFGSYKEDKLHH